MKAPLGRIVTLSICNQSDMYIISLQYIKLSLQYMNQTSITFKYGKCLNAQNIELDHAQ